MKRIALPCLLATSLLPSLALASPCDNKPFYIFGPDHYQYTLRLSQGSIGEKGSNMQAVENQIASPDGDSWNLFSANGTRGDVRGTLIVKNLDTKESVSSTFFYYKNPYNSPSRCEITPHRKDAEIGNFQVQFTGTDNQGMIVKIREFR